MTILRRHFHFTLAVLAGTIMMVSSAVAEPKDNDNDSRARRFIARHEATVRPLETESSRCWWEANTTGSDAAFQKKEEIETRLDLLLANRETFAELKQIHAGPIRDPLVARQIAVLYLQYLGQQIDPALIKEMSARSNAVEKAYSVFRAKVGGKELTENGVHDVLRTSKDSAQRRAVWEASKAVGPILEPDVIKLSRLRNRAARQLGFKDFYVMQLALSELTREQVLKLFDELDALTRRPFHAAKAEIDAALARQCGVRSRRVAAVALSRPVLPGVAGHLWRFRVGLPEDRHGEGRPQVLRGYRPADRRRAGPQRSLRETRQVSARFQPGHGPRGQRPRAGQRGAGPGMADDDAARVGPCDVFEEHPAERSLRLASRVACLDHRRRGNDVRAAGRRCPLA